MNVNKKNLGLPNGWILCPSKSFPGKFYYFNVLNGEAVWSLSDDLQNISLQNNILRKDSHIQKIADKTHNYPEPTNLPDDTSFILPPNTGSNIQKPHLQTSINQNLPTFGQISVPNYVPKVEPIIPSLVWMPITMPMFCQEMKKPMIDEVTQTSEVERELFIQTCDIPLCKRFKNYENTTLCFDKKNKIMNKPRANFGTSTPMKHSFYNIKSENGIPSSNTLSKEPVSKMETETQISKIPEMVNWKTNSTISTPNKVENAIAEKVVPMLPDRVLENLDKTDLRFLLLAKKRKSMNNIADEIEQCKKPRHSHLHTTPKKVTFDLTNLDCENSVTSEENIQEDFTPLTGNSLTALHLKHELNTPLPSAKNDTYGGVSNTPLTQCTKIDTYERVSNTPLTQFTKNTKYREVQHTPLTQCAKNDTYTSVPNTPLTQCAKNDTHGSVPNTPLSQCAKIGTYIETKSPTSPCYNNTQTKDLGVACVKNDIWYIIVDTDVILLDYQYIDNLVLSDPKCKLIIPHLVRVDIEKLCIGVCHGQQRIINARQLIRKLATPPPHFIVQPAPLNDRSVMTTDGILDCCAQAVNKNRYVVLITNDPYLQSEAKKLKIPSYRLNEIKNDVCNKRGTPPEFKKIKMNIHNDSDKVKKQKINISDCDKLISITKSKYQKVDNNYNTSDISSEVQKLKENTILKQQNDNNNAFVPQNVTNTININEGVNYSEKTIPNSKAILNEINFEPQPLQSKNRTRASTHLDSPIANDKIRTRELKTIDSVDENLRRFCVKSKIMNEKICTRMDEWMCTYMQIIEEVLNDLLQKNSECMKDTVAPLTLYDKLNCIKMLYDTHTNVIDIVDNLSNFLSRCTSEKGNLKSFIRPDDFMKVLGYGVWLVQALKNIQYSEELSDAESCLNSLLHNIENNSKELVPELQAPSVCSADLDSSDEVRPYFVKGTSYIMNYLKSQHFKEWAAHKEATNCQNNSSTSQNQPDFNVLRTFGKNLNMLKIGGSKTMTLIKTATVNDPTIQSQEPKLIRLLENQPILSQREDKFKEKNDQNNESNIQTLTKDNNIIIDNKLDSDTLKVVKPIEFINQNANNDTKFIEDLNIPTHGNTFSHNNEISGPKMIRNIQLIDEYEKKIKNKEPLDLDLLDYSHIYEPSADEYLNVLQFDDCDKTGSNIYKYGFTDEQFTEDFTEDISLAPDDYFDQNNYDSNNKNYTLNTANNIIIDNKEHITTDNKINESFDLTDNNISKSHNKNDSGTEIDKSGNDNCIDYNSETHKNNFEKTAELVRDDSTNDSGFENDSTYAHTVVKIFLNELSSSFKVIYEFVNKFVIEIRGKKLCEMRINLVHNQASKSLEDMVAIIQRLRSIIKRESAEETVLKTLLLKAGVEATTDKRITRYRQIVTKSLEQAQILENALKIIVSTTVGDFDGLSTNAESINSSIKYFNIFE